MFSQMCINSYWQKNTNKQTNNNKKKQTNKKTNLKKNPQHLLKRIYG